MAFLQIAAASHPLDGTAAEWIWLVLLLPLIGTLVNGVMAAIAEWRPGPYDPDRNHWGRRGVGAHGEHIPGVTEELRAMISEAHGSGAETSHLTEEHVSAEGHAEPEEPH